MNCAVRCPPNPPIPLAKPPCGCPAPAAGTPPPTGSPAPTVAAVNPPTMVAGTAATTLSVTGSNFTASSVINAGGVDMPTTFVSPTQLTATGTVPSTEGDKAVLVRNEDGATSNSKTVTVTPEPAPIPAPVLTALQPLTTTVGDAPFLLTVTGSNFEAASVIRINNVDAPTTFVSATSLTTTVTPPAAEGSMSVIVRNGDGQTSNGLVLTVAPEVDVGEALCTITGYFPDCVTIGGVAFAIKVLGTGFSTSHVVQFDGVDQLTTYTLLAGKESLSVNALTSGATAGVKRITVRESTGAIAQVGDFTTFDPAVSDPPWMPEGASHYVDFLNDAQARGWDGVKVCDNASMSAMLGNDSNASGYHTPNPTGYNGNNVTADGYDWNKGQNQVPAFEGTMKEALIYVGATVVLDYNSSAAKNDIHLALVAAAASNHIAIKKAGLDVTVTSMNGPLSLAVVGALIEPGATDFVRNRIAFTKTDTRFEIAVNGSPVVAGVLDPADLTGIVAVCDQSKLIGGYTVYPALPDTAGLSELSALT